MAARTTPRRRRRPLGAIGAALALLMACGSLASRPQLGAAQLITPTETATTAVPSSSPTPIPPSATPLPSPTPSPLPASGTPTPAPSATATPAPSASASAGATGTTLSTQTETATPSSSPSPTTVATASSTATPPPVGAILSLSETPTPTATPVATPSPSATGSATSSPSPSPSPAQTATHTQSPTSTRTPTATAFPTGIPTVIGTIAVQSGPGSIDVNAKTNRVYVRHTTGGAVSRIIDAQGTPVAVATIVVGQGPGGLSLNRTTNRLYVANGADSTISVVDGPSSLETARLSVSGAPQDVAVNPGSGYVYVANSPTDSVLVFEEDRVAEGAAGALATIPVGSAPKAIAVNPDTNRVYVANYGSGTVSVIDERTLAVVETIHVGLGPAGIAVNSRTNRIYVTNSIGSSLSIVDGERNLVLTPLVSVGAGPAGVAVSPLTEHVFVANRTDSTVSVVDGTTGAVLATLPVGASPMGVAVNTASGRVYVANNGSSSVTVIQDTVITATATPSPTPPTSSPTPTPVTGPDLFEPDDNRDQARPLILGNDAQVRSIHALGNQDWTHLSIASAPLTVRIVASSTCDVMLDLFDSDGVRLGVLGLDDDGGLGLSSSLVHTFTANGTYFVRVRHYVVEWPASPTPTSSPSPTTASLAASLLTNPFSGPGLCREYTLGVWRLLSEQTATPTRVPSPTASITPTFSGTVAPTRTRTPTRTPTVTRTPVTGPTVRRPFSWGAGYFGQLGDAATARPAPSRLSATAVAGIPEAAGIAAGGDHSLALMRDGAVRAWGVNTHGQLGDGTVNDRYVPVPVAGLVNVRAIAAGGDHSLALTQAGRVYAWGHNLFGQLGTGSTAGSIVPAQVAGLADVVAIAAGNGFSLALTHDGRVWSWGSNYFGQLGTADNVDRLAPVMVPGLSGIAAIAAGGGHSLALQSDGRVKAWGHNVRGQLGDGTTFDRFSPVSVVDLGSASAIDAGFGHSLAIVLPAAGDAAAGGTVYAWGDNTSGQVGNGTIDPFHPRPRAVSGVGNAVSISAGGSHSLAVRSARAGGAVAAWGNNTRGQLGNGSTDDSLVPKDATGSANSLVAAAGFFHSLSLRVVPAGGLPTPTPQPTATTGTGALPQVIDTIAVAGDPADVAVNTSTNRVYVSHIGVESLTSTDQVSVIDASTNAVTTVGLTVSTSGLAVNASAARLYLANFFEPSFTVLSTEGSSLTQLATIPVPNGPVAVAYHAGTGRVYVSSFSEHQLVVIDVSAATPAIVATIPLPNNPVGVAINTTTNRIYVASLSGDSLTVVDGQSNAIIATVATGDGAVGVAVNATTNRVFVANGNASTVTVLDGATNQVLATVPVGANPTGVAVNPGTNHIFVTNRDADTVEVLDGASPSFGVYARLNAGAKPFNLAVNPTTNRVYVANNAGSSVTVIQDYATSGTTGIQITPIAATSGAPVVVAPRPTLIPVASPTPRSIAADILAWLQGGTPTPAAAPSPTPGTLVGPPPFTRPFRVWPPAHTSTQIAASHQGEHGALSLTLQGTTDEPVQVRLRTGAPLTMPAHAQPPAEITIFQVEVLNADGSIVKRHTEPIQICATISDTQLAAGGGDLTRFALLRWNERAGHYERLPQAVVYLVEQRVCASTVETSTFVVAVLPDELLRRPVEDPRYFPETGFRIADDDFWNYFQRRGGLVAFGYPVSRPFQLFGADVQFFQRRVLQRLPDGTVQQLNILDDSLFPFRRVNGSTFPAADPSLIAAAPSPDSPDYATRAIEFVREHAVLDFGRAYFSTVTCADAYPGQPCSSETAALLNLEMWGLPISEPVLDPAHRVFAYQLFQRGILHYDFETDTTRGILLGDWWKALITGEGLPPDLEADAAYTTFWRQFDRQDTQTGMWWPEELPLTTMVAAFAPDLPREPILAEALFAPNATRAVHPTLATQATQNSTEAG